MNEALKEQISAFVDGELSEHETELLLRRLAQDKTLRDAVERYMAIGRNMRREPEIARMAELRGRVAQAIDGQEKAQAGVERQGVSRHIKPVAGMAVAASVAIVALFGLRQGTELPGSAMDVAETVAAAGDVAYTVPSASGAEGTAPSSGLARFYLKHGATTSAMGSNDVNSRLVSFELLETGIIQPETDEAAANGDDDEAGAKISEE